MKKYAVPRVLEFITITNEVPISPVASLGSGVGVHPFILRNVAKVLNPSRTQSEPEFPGQKSQQKSRSYTVVCG